MKRTKFIVTPAYEQFLVRLRLARQEKNVSQRELARRMRVHWSYVVRSEGGKRALDIVELRAICEALGIPFVEFARDLGEVLNATADSNTKNENATPNENISGSPGAVEAE